MKKKIPPSNDRKKKREKSSTWIFSRRPQSLTCFGAYPFGPFLMTRLKGPSWLCVTSVCGIHWERLKNRVSHAAPATCHNYTRSRFLDSVGQECFSWHPGPSDATVPLLYSPGYMHNISILCRHRGLGPVVHAAGMGKNNKPPGAGLD